MKPLQRIQWVALVTVFVVSAWAMMAPSPASTSWVVATLLLWIILRLLRVLFGAP